MDTMECLRTRRSIRKYRTDPLPQDVLEAILQGALYAPSAVNHQHWYFVVLQSPQQMERFRGIMGQVQEKFRPILEDRFQAHPQVTKATETFHTTLGHAPVCVLAFFRKPDFPDRDGAMQSVSAAIENLMLGAWAQGVGSCWMSSPQRMGFGTLLQETFAPGKGEFVSAITLGYPEVVGNPPPRHDQRYVIL